MDWEMRGVLRRILQGLVEAKISIDEAEKMLKVAAIEEVSEMARLDVNREVWKGFPEIILAEGKGSEDLAKVAVELLEKRGRAIISRINKEQLEAVRKLIPNGSELRSNKRARMIVLKREGFVAEKTGGKIGILTAGTSDIPVAEEAKVVAEEMGCEVITAYDVGVAGIHRLFPPLREMINEDVDAIVVVAGREGALASVVAGVVDVPVIGVPTSSGYGFGAKGVGALMAMLQACSLGIAVVNIDGGVPAGAIAALIANRIAKAKEPE
jgi:hypothetical protein